MNHSIPNMGSRRSRLRSRSVSLATKPKHEPVGDIHEETHTHGAARHPWTETYDLETELRCAPCSLVTAVRPYPGKGANPTEVRSRFHGGILSTSCGLLLSLSTWLYV